MMDNRLIISKKIKILGQGHQVVLIQQLYTLLFFLILILIIYKHIKNSIYKIISHS